MMKMTRNITRLKITSDLQIKHELASRIKSSFTNSCPPGFLLQTVYQFAISQCIIRLCYLKILRRLELGSLDSTSTKCLPLQHRTNC
jgi:hypothetical protein